MTDITIDNDLIEKMVTLRSIERAYGSVDAMMEKITGLDDLEILLKGLWRDYHSEKEKEQQDARTRYSEASSRANAAEEATRKIQEEMDTLTKHNAILEEKQRELIAVIDLNDPVPQNISDEQAENRAAAAFLSKNSDRITACLTACKGMREPVYAVRELSRWKKLENDIHDVRSAAFHVGIVTEKHEDLHVTLSAVATALRCPTKKSYLINQKLVDLLSEDQK